MGSENQKNLNTDEMEESVDAIAKELEKSDSEVKKSGKKEKSPKKGKKQQQTGENKEDWVTLIFGENGEKVTEKGTPKSKQAKPEENKTEEKEIIWKKLSRKLPNQLHQSLNLKAKWRQNLHLGSPRELLNQLKRSWK